MAESIRLVIRKEKKIAVIPNSSDTEIFRPDIDSSAIRKERGWDSKLVFMHFGAIGRANGLNFLIDAASRLRCYRDIRFVVVGDGGEKASLVERVEREGLVNVEFLGSVAKTELASLVAACDVSLVVFANYPILEHNSANKFFDSLSAGKPILLNYGGWQRDVLEHNGAGFGCDMCELDQFVERVLFVRSNKGALAQMGRNARLVAEKEFSRYKLAAQVLGLLQALVDKQLGP
jgi:glycosyltransferase involved in cell wall biosynthesis